MRPIRHFLAVCFILPGLLLSQESAPSDTLRQAPYLGQGWWGLQFELQFREGYAWPLLRPFLGTLVSGKYHLTPKSALRAGLSVDLSDSDGEYQSESNQDRESSGFSVQCTAQYLFYFTRFEGVHVYFGGGPAVRYSKFQGKDQTQTYTRRSKTTGGSVGLNGSVGAEVFVYKSVSVFGEYGSLIEYTWESFKSEHDDRWISPPRFTTNRDSRRAFRASATGVRLGTSIYF